MMTQATEAILQARAAGDQLHKLAAQASAQVKDSIAAFENKMNDVVGKPGGFFTAPSAQVTLNRANGDVATLYGDVDRADAVPNAAQASALAETERNFASVMQRWNALKNTDLPALNRTLKGASLPEVQLRTAALGQEE
jgi:hypothetical protein